MIKIDKKYLPSKKFLIALSIAIFIILIAVILNFWKPGSHKNEGTLLAVNNTNASSTPMNIDSDSDGLPDWKEALYGTDPHKADTDGDGTTDTVEIADGRDPLKANTSPAGQTPNDYISADVVAQNQKIVTEYENLNPTEKLSEDLMSNIFASQPVNGQNMDQSTMDSIVQQSIQDLPQKNYTGITQESDLNLIPVNPKTFDKDLLTYAQGYYIQTEVYRKIEGQDLNIINTYLSSGKDDKVGIAKIVSQYQNIVDNLIAAPVPALPGSSGAIYYLALINNLEKLIKIDNDIINSQAKDMASVFSDLSVYNSVMNELMSVLGTLDTVLKINR